MPGPRPASPSSPPVAAEGGETDDAVPASLALALGATDAGTLYPMGDRGVSFRRAVLAPARSDAIATLR